MAIFLKCDKCNALAAAIGSEEMEFDASRSAVRTDKDFNMVARKEGIAYENCQCEEFFNMFDKLTNGEYESESH